MARRNTEGGGGNFGGPLAAVAFGPVDVSNPNLVERVKAGAPLAEPDGESFYSAGAKGYTDYPALAAG